MELRKFLLILTLATVILLALVIWFYPSSDNFRADNPFWNGIRDFSAQFKASLITSLDDLPHEPKDTTLVMIPYLHFSDSELDRLRDYVSNGGTLIVLDDYGYGNEIVDYLGVKTKFTHEPLLDSLFNYRNKWFPRITNFAPGPTTEGVESIILNHASSLSDASEGEVLAWSSRFSFLDTNGNSTYDEGEPIGPLPVAAIVKVDEGKLVLIADPSILINSMGEMGDNYTFIKNVSEIQAPNPQILVGQSHLPEETLRQAKGILALLRAKLSTSLGILAIIVVALTLILRPIWRKR